MRVFKPRQYQEMIIEHILTHGRCAVWAGMGMGKTVATLSAVGLLQEVEMLGPALVIAPPRVAVTTWPDEVRKWEEFSDMHVTVLAGLNPTQRRAALQNRNANIYTINYELIPWLVEELGREWFFDIIVADEASKLKSFRTHQGGARAKALARVAFMSKVFVELTGTPTSNGWEDVWGQMWFIDRGEALGRSMTQFHETYFRPRRVSKEAFAVQWDLLPGSEQYIMDKTKAHVLKLRSEDWFKLEEPIVTDVVVELPPTARTAYNEMERMLFTSVQNNDVEAANAAVKTGKCLQIASGCLYYEDTLSEGETEECPGKHPREYAILHEAKIDALRSIVDEAYGRPILVAYSFRHEAEQILRAFPQARMLDRSPETIHAWNEGRIPIMLAHPASCGHGLSLQDGGNILVFYSTGWNLEEHEQIIERIGPTRQAQSGHARSVFVYNIVAKDTLDEAVQERLRTKRDVLDMILERRRKAIGYDTN